MTTIFDGVEVNFVGITDISEVDPQKYVEYVRSNTTDPVTSITVTQCDDGMVDVNYRLQGPKFERIRRITGYCATRLCMKSAHAA